MWCVPGPGCRRGAGAIVVGLFYFFSATVCAPLGVGFVEHFSPSNFPRPHAPFFVKNKVVGVVAKIGVFLQYELPADSFL